MNYEHITKENDESGSYHITHAHLVHHDWPEASVTLAAEHPRSVYTTAIAADAKGDLALINIYKSRILHMTRIG